MKPKTHLIIPDVQARPGAPIDHLFWIGNYCAEKRPDRVICLGDFADMPSLSGYDIGKASAEGKRYAADIAVTKQAMDLFMRPVRKMRNRPDLIMTLGNHEDRIDRESNANPKWKGFLSSANLGYAEAGWKVVPFLEVATVDRISYSHYFVSGNMGRPVSSAAALLRQRQCSAVMGHVQKQDYAVHPMTQYFGLFAGICYQHKETYLTPQGQDTKRGVWMLHEIRNGTADIMFVSLGFLRRKYS